MSVHDGHVEYRTRLVAVIEASENKRAACAAAGIHPSSFYRWRNRPGPVVRRVSWAEQRLVERIIATALAYPSAGPRTVADRLCDEGLVVSASKVWRTLAKHRLNTRVLRYALLKQHRAPASIQVAARSGRYVGRLNADQPGDLVQLDCFHVGSFKETRLGAAKQHTGQIWQYRGFPQSPEDIDGVSKRRDGTENDMASSGGVKCSFKKALGGSDRPW